MTDATPDAGVFVGREHRLPVRVYYEDTDFTGVVYHANYARYFERGRSDFLRAAGVDHSALLALDDPCAFTLTRLSIDFLAAARIDDALTVCTRYDEIRGARLVIRQAVRRGEIALARAEVEAVCIRPGGGARRPPAALVARLRPLLAPGG
ncbi:MAG TPA: YbgC/FadM family acyl-CoA thioesterase [Caulobacteraceae bacterium]|jgi:acyl-CoA thioester hydrolase|nr:YbgC/FadM family acyl-CoA thioesterase [Caulobacteraceae bacterium]